MNDEVRDRLYTAGMTAGEADRKSELIEKASGSLRLIAPDSDRIDLRLFAPGRIEVLGKHTDYAGGRSLICAIERGICFVATARSDSPVRIIDSLSGELVEFELSASPRPRSGHWSNYPGTVARRIVRNFGGDLRGADIALAGDLPQAAGLSSSSALVTGCFSVIAKINSLETTSQYRANIHTSEDLAAFLGCVENGLAFGSLEGDSGVGTFGGSQDHTAILCCRPAYLSLYSFLPVRREREIALPAELTLVVAASGVRAEKTVEALSKYNRLSLLTVEILRLANQHRGAAARSAMEAIGETRSDLEEIVALLREPKDGTFSAAELIARAEQLFVECREIIPAVAQHLGRGDWDNIGELVDRSQRLAEEALRNQIPETIFLARNARDLGAIASSAFGAGFGGSVWALVYKIDRESFAARWRQSYLTRFPIHSSDCDFFETAAGPSLTWI